MKKISLAIIFVALLFNVSFSQSQSESQRKYENGKELFNLGKYGLAMQEFQPLTSIYNDNPYIKYASYYYGVAAYRKGELNESKYMFRSILSNFPDWEKAEAVNLWLTKIALEQRDYKTGLLYFREIKSDSLKERGEEMVINELSKIDQYEKLYEIYQEHPDSKAVAIALANKIQEQPLQKLDRGLLLNLVSLFDLDEEKYNIKAIAESEKKDVYQIAVLFPFMYNELKDSRQNIINEFVVELYKGMLLAQNKLRSKGIKVELLCYDTEKDSAKTARILKKPEMQHMDLIVGPLYPQPVKLASQFSYDHQINMINPLSTNAHVIGNNPYSFLFFPTNKTLGTKTAEWLINNTSYREGIIFYGTQEKDSVLAFSFKRQFEEDNAGKILLTKKINESNTKEIIKLLTRKADMETESEDDDTSDDIFDVDEEEIFKIRRDSIDFILVSSDNPSMAASTITALETRQDSITLIGKGSWLKSPVVSYESLERLNAYIIAPTFIDDANKRYKDFKNSFIENYNSLPSENACTGFELIYTIGELLYQYGNHYQNELDEGDFKQGYLYAGYMLNKENDNQFFPIVDFENLELKKVNPRK